MQTPLPKHLSLALTCLASSSFCVLPVQAQDSSARSGALEEVIVTANRRAENLQDVPISMSVLGGKDLGAARIDTVQDLTMQTPGLTMSNQSAAMTPFIRGVGAVDNTVGQEAAVSTYLDGVYIPSTYGALFSFNNIERVEVLKGPQGTLFGRNATGGLIHIVTLDPSHETSGNISASMESHDTYGLKFYGTAGITDTLAADLAVIFRRQNEGFGRNQFNGRDVGFVGDEGGVRSKWLYEPSEDLTIKLSLDYLETESDLGTAKNFLPGAISTVDLQPGVSNFRNVRTGMHETLESRQWGAALHVNYATENFDIVSITAQRDLSVLQQFDNDGTNTVFLDAYVDDHLNP